MLMYLNNKTNRKGQIAIVLMVILTLMLAGASMYIFYLAQKDILPKLQSADSVSNLYKKADIAKVYVADTLKEAVAESNGDSSKIQSIFIDNFKWSNLNDWTLMDKMFGGKTSIADVIDVPPVFLQTPDKIRVDIKNEKISYKDPANDIVEISYTFDIEAEETLPQPAKA